MTIVHGSLGSFVTSFHRYHSSLGPFFLTVFDRRARSARYTRFTKTQPSEVRMWRGTGSSGWSHPSIVAKRV